MGHMTRRISVNDIMSRKKNKSGAAIKTRVSAVVPDYPPFQDSRRARGRDPNYQCDDTVAQRKLNVLNECVGDAAQSGDSDPYNTCEHDTSKSWGSTGRN